MGGFFTFYCYVFFLLVSFSGRGRTRGEKSEGFVLYHFVRMAILCVYVRFI